MIGMKKNELSTKVAFNQQGRVSTHLREVIHRLVVCCVATGKISLEYPPQFLSKNKCTVIEITNKMLRMKLN